MKMYFIMTYIKHVGWLVMYPFYWLCDFLWLQLRKIVYVLDPYFLIEFIWFGCFLLWRSFLWLLGRIGFDEKRRRSVGLFGTRLTYLSKELGLLFFDALYLGWAFVVSYLVRLSFKHFFIWFTTRFKVSRVVKYILLLCFYLVFLCELVLLFSGDADGEYRGIFLELDLVYNGLWFRVGSICFVVASLFSIFSWYVLFLLGLFFRVIGSSLVSISFVVLVKAVLWLVVIMVIWFALWAFICGVVAFVYRGPNVRLHLQKNRGYLIKMGLFLQPGLSAQAGPAPVDPQYINYDVDFDGVLERPAGFTKEYEDQRKERHMNFLRRKFVREDEGRPFELAEPEGLYVRLRDWWLGQYRFRRFHELVESQNPDVELNWNRHGLYYISIFYWVYFVSAVFALLGVHFDRAFQIIFVFLAKYRAKLTPKYVLVLVFRAWSKKVVAYCASKGFGAFRVSRISWLLSVLKEPILSLGGIPFSLFKLHSRPRRGLRKKVWRAIRFRAGVNFGADALSRVNVEHEGVVEDLTLYRRVSDGALSDKVYRYAVSDVGLSNARRLYWKVAYLYRVLYDRRFRWVSRIELGGYWLLACFIWPIFFPFRYLNLLLNEYVVQVETVAVLMEQKVKGFGLFRLRFSAICAFLWLDFRYYLFSAPLFWFAFFIFVLSIPHSFLEVVWQYSFDEQHGYPQKVWHFEDIGEGFKCIHVKGIEWSTRMRFILPTKHHNFFRTSWIREYLEFPLFDIVYPHNVERGLYSSTVHGDLEWWRLYNRRELMSMEVGVGLRRPWYWDDTIYPDFATRERGLLWMVSTNQAAPIILSLCLGPVHTPVEWAFTGWLFIDEYLREIYIYFFGKARPTYIDFVDGFKYVLLGAKVYALCSFLMILYEFVVYSLWDKHAFNFHRNHFKHDVKADLANPYRRDEFENAGRWFTDGYAKQHGMGLWWDQGVEVDWYRAHWHRRLKQFGLRDVIWLINRLFFSFIVVALYVWLLVLFQLEHFEISVFNQYWPFVLLSVCCIVIWAMWAIKSIRVLRVKALKHGGLPVDDAAAILEKAAVKTLELKYDQVTDDLLNLLRWRLKKTGRKLYTYGNERRPEAPGMRSELFIPTSAQGGSSLENPPAVKG